MESMRWWQPQWLGTAFDQHLLKWRCQHQWWVKISSWPRTTSFWNRWCTTYLGESCHTPRACGWCVFCCVDGGRWRLQVCARSPYTRSSGVHHWEVMSSWRCSQWSTDECMLNKKSPGIIILIMPIHIGPEMAACRYRDARLPTWNTHCVDVCW